MAVSILSVGILLVTGACVLAQDLPEPACLCLQEVEEARGFRNPLILRHAGDGTRRRYIAEQIGLVWIFEPNGNKLEEPFLNLTQVVKTSDRPGDERGFLQIAFHPSYATNRKLYIYYTFEDAETEVLYSRLSEILRSQDNPNKVDHTTERVLLDMFQPFQNHNGGDILFGPDGYLYLSLGDGGLAGDPYDQAQNKSSFLGKMVRIDVNREENGKPYAIPADNPYLGEEGALPELYAIGLRNPWRNDMDLGDRATGEGRGRIFVSDVGQNWMEEVNILESKGNYAWPAREGYECYRSDLCGQIGPEVLPIYAYNHTVGQCIIGGHVYRGCENPALNGWYFFGDYMTGRLYRLKQDAASGRWLDREVVTCGNDACGQYGLVGNYSSHSAFLSFGVDEDGEQYFMSTDVPSPFNRGGRVYKLVDPFNRGSPCTPQL